MGDFSGDVFLADCPARLAIEIIGGHGFGPAAPVLRIQAIALAGVFVNTVWSMNRL